MILYCVFPHNSVFPLCALLLLCSLYFWLEAFFQYQTIVSYSLLLKNEKEESRLGYLCPMMGLIGGFPLKIGIIVRMLKTLISFQVGHFPQKLITSFPSWQYKFLRKERKEPGQYIYFLFY